MQAFMQVTEFDLEGVAGDLGGRPRAAPRTIKSLLTSASSKPVVDERASVRSAIAAT